MEHEPDTTFSNMYLGTEIRFDGIAEMIKNLAAKIRHRPVANRNSIAA